MTEKKKTVHTINLNFGGTPVRADIEITDEGIVVDGRGGWATATLIVAGLAAECSDPLTIECSPSEAKARLVVTKADTDAIRASLDEKKAS